MKSASFRERARRGREHAQKLSGPIADSFRDVAQVWEDLASRLDEVDRLKICAKDGARHTAVGDSDRGLERGPKSRSAAGISDHGA